MSNELEWKMKQFFLDNNRKVIENKNLWCQPGWYALIMPGWMSDVYYFRSADEMAEYFADSRQPLPSDDTVGESVHYLTDDFDEIYSSYFESDEKRLTYNIPIELLFHKLGMLSRCDYNVETLKHIRNLWNTHCDVWNCEEIHEKLANGTLEEKRQVVDDCCIDSELKALMAGVPLKDIRI